MIEKWTGKLVGKMHNYRITLEDVGKEMGVSKPYVSMILNGSRKPPNARARLESAVDAIIDRQKKEG